MADWYVSSVAWTAIAQFAASTAYTVGNIIRPLTAPNFNAQFAFRCTTAGTSGAEPSWAGAASNGSTVTTGGATFTNVSGQSTYGWSAAAGNIYCVTNNGAGAGRFAAGDRLFLSSDHSESSANNNYTIATNAGFGVIEAISVNRAGNVPPQAADVLSGASVATTASSLILDPATNVYWQGVTFTLSSTGVNFILANSGTKTQYFKNCAFVFGGSANASAYIGSSNPCGVIFDNTPVTFSAAGQRITFNTGGYAVDFKWINTPSAVLGTVPTDLFTGGTSSPATSITCRGLDLSAVTTTLYYGGAGAANACGKVLFDSCRIASGVVRLGTASYQSAADEVELVNCYDGTHFNAERHTPAGDLTTEFSTTMVGGAQDDIGLYSHKLVSSTRCDPWTMTLDSFWLDVENTLVGVSHTATVEIISSASLNNTDITVKLQYEGTSGSSLASFADSITNPLVTVAALPTSTATWNNAPAGTWNPSDASGNITLSGGNLIATVTTTAVGGVRSNFFQTTGKWYWEITCTTFGGANDAVGVANATGSLVGGGAGNIFVAAQNGHIYNAGTDTGVVPGTLPNGSLLCVALDMVNGQIWFRVGAAGNWNGSSGNNPATNVGGVATTTLAGVAYALVSMGVNSGHNVTANFGASAFTGTAPSGFAAPALGAQHIQVSFTPQQAGRLRAMVRLGKASSTVWINPQIAVT